MKHLVGVIVGDSRIDSKNVDILGFKLADVVGNISNVSLTEANKLLLSGEIFCNNPLQSMLREYSENKSKWKLSLKYNMFKMSNGDTFEKSSIATYSVFDTKDKLLVGADILIIYYNPVTRIAVAYNSYENSVIYLLAIDKVNGRGVCSFLDLSSTSGELVYFEYYYLGAETALQDGMGKITENTGMFDKLLNLYILYENSSPADLILLPSDCKFLTIGLLYLSDGLSIVFNPSIEEVFMRDGAEIASNTQKFKVNFSFSSKTRKDIVNAILYEIRKDIVDSYGVNALDIDFCVSFY